MSFTTTRCNREILEANGWHAGYQNYHSCVVCRHGGHDFFGWRSPGYKFYHDWCLLGSKRYANMVKRANNACTPTDGTHPANEPVQAENNPVISGESTPTIGG